MNTSTSWNPYCIGLPVTGPDFVGRADELDSIFRGDQLLWFMGARRAGKSSLLLQAARPDVQERFRRVTGSSLHAVYVDLQQDPRTPDGFRKLVADAIQRSLRAPELSPEAVSDEYSWSGWVKARNEDQRPVLLLDEIEALGNERVFDASFFGGLRALCTDGIRFVLTSRPGYRSAAQDGADYALSPFNNYFRVAYLGALVRRDAVDLVQIPAGSAGIQYSREEVDHILRLAGGVPCIIQIVASSWFAARKEGRAGGTCENAVCEVLSDPDRELVRTFDTWLRHLQKSERTLLERVASEGSLGPFSPATRDAIDALRLENAGLLVRDGGVFRVYGDLLRTWILGPRERRKRSAAVFLGHGRDGQWNEVYRFLKDRLKVRVIYFEDEPCGGAAVNERLQEILDEADFGIIVATAEDPAAKGRKRPRQNVVHETGLFQGNKGWKRVLLLAEDNADLPGNVDGLVNFRFARGNIRSTFFEIESCLRKQGLLLQPE